MTHNCRVRIGLQALGTLIDIDPQDTCKKISIYFLAVVQGVIGRAFIPQGNIEKSIGAKMKITSIMVSRIVPLIDENGFGGWLTDH